MSSREADLTIPQSDEARDRLLHIAVILQAEIIRSLQIAIQYENAVLDLTLLQETAVINRQNTITTLDGLRQRILRMSPIERPMSLLQIREVERRASMDSVRTYMTANTVAPAADYVPPAVIITHEPETRTGITRLLSRRSIGGRNLPTSDSRISLIPNFDWLAPLIRPNEHDFVASCLRDFDATQPEGLNADMVDRNNSTSTNSTSTRSGYSDKILYTTAALESIDSVLPTTPPQQAWSPGSFSPTTLDGGDSFGRGSLFDRNRLGSNTVQTPLAGTNSMMGRPSKDNNYWGFCKGAWSTREKLTMGLQIQTRPEGMYNTKSIWECRHCSFQGEAYGTKRPYTVDQSVHVAPNGIWYRWIFLAKSHVRKKNAAVDREQYNFGCMFCCGEGKPTGIFGNVETLMNHIYLEHAREMTPVVQEKTCCVFGRVAGAGEVFDINIPDNLLGYG